MLMEIPKTSAYSKGIIRYVDVHDINEAPGIEKLVVELEKLQK